MTSRKENNCVRIDIHVKCNNCDKHDEKGLYEEDDCKKDEDNSCVKINIFVDCDKK